MPQVILSTLIKRSHIEPKVFKKNVSVLSRYHHPKIVSFILAAFSLIFKVDFLQTLTDETEFVGGFYELDSETRVLGFVTEKSEFGAVSTPGLHDGPSPIEIGGIDDADDRNLPRQKVGFGPRIEQLFFVDIIVYDLCNTFVIIVIIILQVFFKEI